MLRATVRIPSSIFEPGPRGARFHVVDYNPITQTLAQPYTLFCGSGETRDPFHSRSDKTLLRDHRFHAQNVFVIAARTLGIFESALGRRIP